MIQNYTKVKKEILEYLFERYLEEGGAKAYDISSIIYAHGFSLTEVGTYLVQNKLVKNAVFKPKEFLSAISVIGLKEVGKNWLESRISQTVAYLIVNGNKRTSLMEILDFETNEFQIAVDLAKAFEEIGFVKIEILEQDITISLNSKGWENYSDKKLSHF